MKRVSPLIRNSSETDLNAAMTPMIDVVFLLLVFFVWTASFQVVEFILPSELSEQMGSQPVEAVNPPVPDDFDDVIVRIQWEGDAPVWTINEQPYQQITAVAGQLKAIAGVGADAVVILHPDPEVPLGPVIETYDVARIAGFEKVAFAVNPRPNP